MESTKDKFSSRFLLLAETAVNLQFVKGFLGDGVLFNELWENLGGKTWENVGMKEYVNWFFNYIHIVT